MTLESKPSEPEGAADLNALVNFTWSDDSIADAAELEEFFAAAEKFVAAAERPLAQAPADYSGSHATPLLARVSAAPEALRPPRPKVSERPRDQFGRDDPVATGEPARAPLRSKRRAVAVQAAPAAEDPEVALRRAFASQPGWRRVSGPGTSWRGAKSLVALLANGSMAAGMAIALLLARSPLLGSETNVATLWAEASADSAGASRNGAPLAEASPEQARANAAASAMQAATQTPSRDLSSGEARQSERGVTPRNVVAGDVAAPKPTISAEPAAAAMAARSGDSPPVSGEPDLRDASTRPTALAGREGDALTQAAAALVLAASASWDSESRPASPMAGARQSGASGDIAPEAVFRHALDVAIKDPRAGVVAYARAAMLGHERAAYYLGQIYETGDGVPVDYAMARHWYGVASVGDARARDRLADLPGPEQAGEITAPLPLLAEPRSTVEADFFWTSGDGADPASYVIELSTDPGAPAVAAHPVTGSATRLPLAPEASHWRVLALDTAGNRTAASGWQLLSYADRPASPFATRQVRRATLLSARAR